MYVLFTDETNREPTDNAKFFIYGGLLFPVDIFDTFHNEVEKIRVEAGYKKSDEFKFNTHDRPKYVDFKTCTKAKQKVIELCQSTPCKFIAYIILHDIIKNKDPQENIKWAADALFERYNYYLHLNESTGICVVDN